MQSMPKNGFFYENSELFHEKVFNEHRKSVSKDAHSKWTKIKINQAKTHHTILTDGAAYKENDI